MYSGKLRIRLWPLLMAAALVLCSMVGVALGKYIHSTRLHATVTFSAKLAESMVLEEHEAERLPDGSYTLDPDVTVTENTYTLIPGLDVPKDPYITIKGKTPIDAYLFVEVMDEMHNTAISYKLTDQWLELNTIGKHSGKVYVYTGGAAEPAVIDDSVGALFTVYLLEKDADSQTTITVGQKLLSGAPANILKIYACMGETASSGETDSVKRAIAVYNAVT